MGDFLFRFFAVTTVSTAMAFADAEPARLHRILYYDRALTAAEMKALKFQYGAEVLNSYNARHGTVRVTGTVYHALPAEAADFIGHRNPILERSEIINKYMSKANEADLLSKHAPDRYPKTERISEVLKSLGDLPSDPKERFNAIKAELIERYPKGFFIKPEFGFDSDGKFTTESTDFARIYEIYARELKEKFTREMRTHGSVEEAIANLSSHKDFVRGYALDLMLENPSGVIVQEKLQIKKRWPGFVDPKDEKPIEVRVHFVDGKILIGGSVTRHERLMRPEILADAERAAISVVKRLPFVFDGGMDLLLTEDRGWQVIELNIGGDSGFLHPEYNILATNLLSEVLTGSQTEYLAIYRAILRERDPRTKVDLLEELMRRPELEPLRQHFKHNNVVDSVLQLDLLNTIKKSGDQQSEKRLVKLLDEFDIKVFPDELLGERSSLRLSGSALCQSLVLLTNTRLLL